MSKQKLKNTAFQSTKATLRSTWSAVVSNLINLKHILTQTPRVMDTKVNVQELFFQLKSKKSSQIKSFDRALCSLGIHHELKTALAPAKYDKAAKTR